MSLLLRSQYITPANLIEVREMMEVRVAGLAAERATPEHIERMERALIVLRKARPTVGEVVQADLDFHNELAAATGNPLFSVLSHSMNAVMANLHAGAFRLDSVGAVQGSLLYHSRILDAIKKRDAVEARRTMEEHLADSAGWARRVAESQKGTIAPKADELLAANGTDGDS
jgi:GntR family transcriptional repressor for pyruvate dehydrogenase complex